MNKIRLISTFSKIFNSSNNSPKGELLIVKLLFVLFNLLLFFIGISSKIES